MRKTALLAMHGLAREDARVVFIGSDITKRDLEAFAREFPERFFLEGIYEQHLIGMAAGLALCGKLPYLNTIATFLTGRCYEQIRVDLGFHRAPVRLLASGGGTVYAPLGPTHIANDDLALMAQVPHMAVLAPCDALEMGKLMRASLAWPGPMYIRLAKGGDPVITTADTPFAIGKAVPLRAGRDALFVTTGILTQAALAAAAALAPQGLAAGVLHVHTLKPFDADALRAALPPGGAVVVAEEHHRRGGLGSAVLDALADAPGLGHVKLARLGFAEDRVLDQYGSQQQLLDQAGLNAAGLAAAAQRLLGGG